MGGVFKKWSDAFICGWIYDSVDLLKENFENARGINTFQTEQSGYEDDYKLNMLHIETETNAKLNLGGENEKSKIEFSDKPIGVFDFSLASQLLYRVHEFYNEELKNEEPYLFKEYEIPSGVVPNYYVVKEIVGTATFFYYINNDTGKKYLLEKRQKGLTQVLIDNPSTKIVFKGGMCVPENFTKGVVFSSRTKKPYVKYQKRGGKVKYVEIYSLFYYSSMQSNFSKSVRHLPAVMVCQYLEKMGTLTKFFLTRFVRQPLSGREVPREFDIQTGLELPLYTCVNRIGRSNFNYKLVLQPMCVKNYGEELNKAFIYGASGNRNDLYTATYYGMSESELINNNTGVYGDPNWDENIYQEGFERYRQKYIEYTQKGIWKSKEVNAQSLIYFHDLFLNLEWENWYNEIQFKTFDKYSNYQSDLRQKVNSVEQPAFTIAYSQENTKWFEIWITISANTIRHKLDIYNSNNPRKTFQAIFKDLESILEDIDLLISSETFTPLQGIFEGWKNNAVQYYRLDDPKKYCENRIDEMTYFAKEGCFATPQEDIEKRGLEARRLKNELIKM